MNQCTIYQVGIQCINFKAETKVIISPSNLRLHNFRSHRTFVQTSDLLLTGPGLGLDLDYVGY